MNKNKVWIIGLVLAIGSIFLLLSSAKIAPNKSPALVSAGYNGGWVKGDESAKAVLVEYGDFQCPACRAYYSFVEQLAEDFNGKLKIVYRHFPLTQIHQNALPSAISAEAAGLQGKFWEMYKLLYENQDNWKGLADPKSTFESYANNIGLDMQKFKTDTESKEIIDKIKESADSAVKLRLVGTPTFFLNGEKINNPRSYDEFKALVQKAINQ